MSLHIFYHIVLLFTAISAGKVDPVLKDAVDNNGETEAIVEFPSIQNQISGLESMSGDAKVNKLVTSLQALTSTMQAPLVTAADSMNLTTQQFWIANIVQVKGLTPEKLVDLASVEGNFTIRLQHKLSLPRISEKPVANISNTVQWGVERIRAPEIWKYTKGEGIVVGIIDTGVNLGHVSLSDSFTGQWLDPYYSTQKPTDVLGHGTHVMGIIVGRHGVGVAPGARWMACRGITDYNSATESVLTQCAEFMLTSNPRPNIVSNSWGIGGGDAWFDSQISAWRHAGIIPVFSSGNDGPSCRSVGSPGDNRHVITVGSTDETDEASWFSSRGPSYEYNLKPELSAPGSNIVSCGTGTYNYVSMSGTSMAAPHVAGAIALLLSANPLLGFGDVYDALISSAYQPRLSSGDKNCGLPTGADFPNNAYGYGIIDVAAAFTYGK